MNLSMEKVLCNSVGKIYCLLYYNVTFSCCHSLKDYLVKNMLVRHVNVHIMSTLQVPLNPM